MEPKKYEYIDSLRGVAILLVLAIHVGQHGESLMEIAPLFDKFRFAGHYGVQLFFLLSAYTLMLSNQSRQGESFITRNFFIRRAFRIIPMYYFALIYYTIDSIFFAPYFSIQENMNEVIFSDVMKNICFLNNFYPTMPYYVPGGWSIVAEISFYLLLPFICRYIVDINKAIILFITSLGISCVFSILFFNFHPNSLILYFSFPNQFFVFVMGILVFYLMNWRKNSLNKFLFVILLLVISLYIYFIPDKVIIDCLRASFILFLFILIISKKQYKIIVNSFFSFVGKISYSMYLIHFGVLYWMSRLNFVDFLPCTSKFLCISNYFVRYIVTFLISGILSYITYQYVEKFFMKKGKKIIQLIK